ncbi:NAD(P)-binding domain-containing protein [Streptomyces sp. ISL-22]|uniref:Oxidoreductase n=1 Tax=Streptomyces curacoi TaxID=146536 RepID=A0A117NVJ0_9ACTN|nr:MULTISPECIES: NAD(P)-binding domain-containing protein [Streptomyces]KUM68185.1 oxidoreductase [Streptomyces curacoi]MBT2418969.1 NAD(P)-binding domain-containing protein [Streptomyces sp. ISL-24]MBT2437746.1 NAD(P)-binding domain-containing protein [Streptomyces sp. ISL-22]
MRIGLLGTGNVARALAHGWSTAGHDVLLGSRAPKERADLEGLPVASLSETAAHAEVLVNATPGNVSVELLRSIGAQALAGTLLIDVGVGLSDDFTELSHPNSSLAEQIQEAFPLTPVVKTLCTMDSTAMIAPDSLDGPSTVFLSGDDAEAKRTTGRLLTDLGWPESSQLDIGGITTARGQEHFALLFMGIAGGLGAHTFNINVVPRRR